MNRKAWTVSKINLGNLTVAYTITVIAFLLMTIPNVIQILQAGPDEYFENSYLVSSGLMLYVLLLVAPIIIPTTNFIKIMHLNGRKNDYLKGTFLTYAIFAALVSIANNIFYFTVDQSWAKTFQVINLMEIFGWSDNGVIVSFLQQFAFLLLLAAFVHTLTSLHGSWVGWIVDILLIVFISLSLILPSFTAVMGWFLNLIIFESNVVIQIIACIVFTAIMYVLSLSILNRKSI